MKSPNKGYTINRNIGRRKLDRAIRHHLDQYKKLLLVSQAITSEINMEQLFDIIMDQTNKIMDTERCTIFLYHGEDNKLWSLVATGMGKNEIRIEADKGVAGWIFQHRSPLIVNNPYADKRFYPLIDEITGFKTKNIIGIPLYNKSKACIGVLQTLNKMTEDFNEEDLDLLKLVSNHVAIAIENAKLYEELKVLDKARERIINHLSHEIKTPLAVIAAVFKKLSEQHRNENDKKIGLSIERGQRNLIRLLEFQRKIDDILNRKYTAENEKLLHLIEDAISIVDDLGVQEHTHEVQAVLSLVSKRLESIYPDRNIMREVVLLNDFLTDICLDVVPIIDSRNLRLTQYFDKDIRIVMDKNILKKVCVSLLKNAIENTPDEGLIEVHLKKIHAEALIIFRDYGIGITPENQKLIFGGFFHTQDTKFYTTKNPYEFNAGGFGTDLLRIKTFSERCGFKVDFESSRCKFIPNDADLCPGNISACKYIKEKLECLSSGGSIFRITFPAAFNNDK